MADQSLPQNRIYLAARYSRNPEMRDVRDALERLGYSVTSQWIDNHGGTLEKSFTPERLSAEPEFCSSFALTDITDLHEAAIIVSFTGNGGGGRGGATRRVWRRVCARQALHRSRPSRKRVPLLAGHRSGRE